MQRTTTRNAPDDQFRRPDDWGEDEVTHVLSKVTENMFYTANRNRARLKRLRTAMQLFLDGAKAYAGVRRSYALGDQRFRTEDCVFPFFMSCRTSLFGATTLTFGHQLADAAKALRGALEAAFYGYHVFADPTSWERWAKRPTAANLRTAAGDAARRQRSRVGREFTASTIAQSLPADASRLGSAAMALYEELIDVGGHFNEPVFQANTKMIIHERQVAEIRFTLVGGDAADVRDALDRLIATAATSLRLFAIPFAKFWDERLKDRIVLFTTRE